MFFVLAFTLTSLVKSDEDALKVKGKVQILI